MTIWFVIPCGSEKATTAKPARDLYVSRHFQQTLAKVEAEAAATPGDVRVLILSAYHGLLPLDEVVEPYDVKMGDPLSISEFGVNVTADLCGIAYEDEVYAFLPRRYYDVLAAGLALSYVYPQDVYEATSGIGDQRHVTTVMSR